MNYIDGGVDTEETDAGGKLSDKIILNYEGGYNEKDIDKTLSTVGSIFGVISNI